MGSLAILLKAAMHCSLLETPKASALIQIVAEKMPKHQARRHVEPPSRGQRRVLHPVLRRPSLTLCDFGLRATYLSISKHSAVLMGSNPPSELCIHHAPPVHQSPTAACKK